MIISKLSITIQKICAASLKTLAQCAVIFIKANLMFKVVGN